MFKRKAKAGKIPAMMVKPPVTAAPSPAAISAGAGTPMPGMKNGGKVGGFKQFTPRPEQD